MHELVKKRLVQKKLDEIGLWALLIQFCKRFANNPQTLEWYIKRDKLFLKLSKQEDKTQRHLNKTIILKEINQFLQEKWYAKKISKLIFK